MQMGASCGSILDKAAWLAVAVATLAGCAGRDDRAPARALTVNDFRAAAAPAPQAVSAPESIVVLDQSLGFSPDRGPAGALEVVAGPGAPPAPDAPRPVAAPVVVDQKVGEINTRPVWAAEFLGPMAARMRQWAEQDSPDQWRAKALKRIHEDLRQRLDQELIRADTLAAMPPAHRQGLSYVLEDVFRRERSANRGSEAMVEDELRGKNSTLGEAWQAKRDDWLIMSRQRQWWEQVHVSADEVDLEYHRRYKEFNPDPRAVFRRIRVPASEEEAARRIQQRLDAGEPFVTVAEDSANRNSPGNGGLVEGVGSFPGEYAEAEFWSARELNEAARPLTEGEWTGPFRVGSSMNWLFLERIEREEGASLYDAGPLIRRQLENARANEIAEADFREMQSRASFTDIGLMADRLLGIAERWYLQPALDRRAGSPGRGEPTRPGR
jgi:hypothetical protein